MSKTERLVALGVIPFASCPTKIARTDLVHFGHLCILSKLTIIPPQVINTALAIDVLLSRKVRKNISLDKVGGDLESSEKLNLGRRGLNI